MNDRISRWVARLLAHPAGFAAFNVFSVAWFLLPLAAGAAAGSVWGVRAGFETFVLVRLLLPGYLDVVTWFSSATQFTLAYQNDRDGRKLDDALAELRAGTQALLQMASNETHMQETMAEQTEAIAAALGTLIQPRKEET